MALVAEWHTYNQANNARTGKHRIEINDTQGNTAQGEFSIDWTAGGFELTDGGSPKDLWPIIQPKSLRFTMKVTRADQKAFIRAIGTSTDSSRFTVVYKRGQRPVFAGVILTEAVTYIENPDIMIDGIRYKDGAFVVTAVDGITLLQKITYSETLIQKREPFIYYIAYALSRMPTASLLLPNSILLQTSWIPDTGTANFALNQSVATRVFFEAVNRLGGLQFPTLWDLINDICIGFNMRCRTAYGYYFFQQLDDLSANGYLYNMSGALVGTQNIVSQVQDLESDMLTLRNPHVETYSPPIKEARALYNFKFNSNLANGYKFESNVYTETCYNNISTVSIKNDRTRLRVIGSLEYTPIVTGGHTGQVRAVFWLKIKVGLQYFARDLVVPGQYFYYQYKPTEWTTTETKYYIIGDALATLPESSDNKFYIPIYFSTLPLDEALDNEQLSICFGHELYDTDNVKIFESAVATIAILDDLDITAIDQENNVVERTSIETKITNPAPNEKRIDREIFFSTGPNKSSDNRITDDSVPPVDTINWTVPNQGTDTHYVQLTKSLMSRGMQAQTWMQTVVAGAYQDLLRLNACGAEWIWWSGKYYHSEHQEFHKGEFLQIKVLPVGLTPEEQDIFDVLERPPVPTRGDAGNNVAEIEITGITGSTINADTYNIPMPDTIGWTDEQIRSVVIYNRSGNIQRYKDPPTILNEFAWDNANRNFVLAENSQANLWHIFRIYR